jgi:hypothetical protein
MYICTLRSLVSITGVKVPAVHALPVLSPANESVVTEGAVSTPVTTLANPVQSR